ncbi:MAG TPA: alpha/beta hydrolase [Pseudolabrys sp.]|nr:alpha/beta hydrolase [Pseudolabrys sp.]
MVEFANTPLLRVAYESGGPQAGYPVFLLHGWPDDVRTFDKVAPALQQNRFRTITPYLRGFGPTTFLSEDTMRSGEMVAMAQDVLDLADALKLKTFAVVGHDWGARIAYALAATAPERVTRICALSVGWQPGELTTPSLEQVRKYWYQWFMATERGADTVRRDRKAFARIQWQTWAPKGWFKESEFETTAKSFENPDWPVITVHSYTVRWGEAEKDPRYRDLDRRAKSARTISVPTLMIQGGADGVTLPDTTDGKEKYFTGGYQRHVLDGVGHFPTREAPDAVNGLVIGFLKAK